MLRSLKLYGHVYFLEVRKMLAFRFEFWIQFLGQTLISLCISYFLWKSIFDVRQVNSIQGMTLESLTFYYLLAPILFRLLQGQSIGMMSHDIYQGELNKYLIYPLSYFKFRFSTYLAHASFYAGQLLIILSVYFSFFSDFNFIKLGMMESLFIFIYLFVAVLCYFFISCVIELISFWADNIWSLAVMLRVAGSFLGGVMVPYHFFPEQVKTALNLTPFPYFVSPVLEIFFQTNTERSMVMSLSVLSLWTILFMILTKILWKKGLKQYSGIGI